MLTMKLSPKQVDEVVRLLGTLAAAAISGAAIAVSRPEQVTQTEAQLLAGWFVVLFGSVLYLRRGA